MKKIDKKFSVLIAAIFLCLFIFGGNIQNKLDEVIIYFAGDSGFLQFLLSIVSYVIGIAFVFFITYEIFEIAKEWDKRGKENEQKNE